MNVLIRDAMGYPPARLRRSDRMKTKHARPAAAVVGTLLASALYETPATAGQFSARISGILLYFKINSRTWHWQSVLLLSARPQPITTCPAR